MTRLYHTFSAFSRNIIEPPTEKRRPEEKKSILYAVAFLWLQQINFCDSPVRILWSVWWIDFEKYLFLLKSITSFEYHYITKSKNSQWNRGVATMKSSLCSDEIFGVPPQMKLNPPRPSPREAGFHREAISSTKGGFLPPAADLTEKSILLSQSAFFLWYHYKIDPYKATVQKQSIIFAMRVGLPLGDDGRQKWS